MITTARRRVSGLLGWLAFHVNPDPPLEFSLKQRIDVDYEDLVALGRLGQHIGFRISRN